MKLDEKAFTEVNRIINCMSPSDKAKIPLKFRKFVTNHQDITYCPEINEIPRDIGNLRRQTVIILAIIFNRFWKENGKG